jgi:WD40 repeat protein
MIASARGDAPKPISFKSEIAPIMVESCIACHNQKVKKGKYDMSTFAALMKGGGKGAPVIAGKSAESLLALMMHGDEEPAMPKDADLLPKTVVEKIDLWIDQGAKYDGPSPTTDLRELLPKKEMASAAKDYTRPTPISAIAFRPDGKELAVAGYHEVSFWNPADGALLRRMPTKSERIHALEYSPDGKTLLYAGGTPGTLGQAVLVDVATLKPVREFFNGEDVVFAAAFSPDGSQAAAGGADRMFRVWNVADGKEIHKVENHADWVLGLTFAADGKRLYSAARDKSTKVYDLVAKEPLLTFSGHTDGVYGVGISPDGKTAVSTGADNQLRYWTPSGDAPQVRAVPAHANTAFALRFSKSGKVLLTAGGDNLVKLWNPADGALAKTLEGHADWVYSLALSADEKLAAAGAWDGKVKIWDLGTGKVVVDFLAVPSAALAKAKPPAK